MMIHPMSRRDFMVFAAALFANAVGSPGYAARISTPNDAGNRLSQIFAQDMQAARAIGHAYLREVPGESNAGILAEMIVRSGPVRLRRLDSLSKKDLMDTLRALIRQDFVSENTVMLDGWVLSRTEARLCALCALSQAAS